MSEQQRLTRRDMGALSSLLRRLATEIEKNPELVAKLLQPAQPARANDVGVEGIDLYAMYAEGGERLLLDKLAALNLLQLKRIVQRNGLDPSKLAEKWRDKDRLVNLIVKTVIDRARLGDVFRRG